jgi:hypothetical protein
MKAGGEQEESNIVRYFRVGLPLLCRPAALVAANTSHAERSCALNCCVVVSASAPSVLLLCWERMALCRTSFNLL